MIGLTFEGCDHALMYSLIACKSCIVKILLVSDCRTEQNRYHIIMRPGVVGVGLTINTCTLNSQTSVQL